MNRSCILALFIAFILTLPSICSGTDLSGCWSGTWQSCVTPHKGTLKAEFVRLDDCHYEVFFKGRFFKFLPFQYSTVMTATEQDGVVSLSGSKYLGRIFGTFSFDAVATNCQFTADYSSCKDNGQFIMSRCSYATSCSCN